jgi:cytochrome c
LATAGSEARFTQRIIHLKETPMKNWTKIAASLALASAATFAHAETPEVAKALLDAAVAEFKAKGAEATVKDINAGGKWNKGTLYVVVAQFDGTMLAHSANDKIPGKNLFEVKDASGKPFVKETIAAVKANGSGQVEMRWANPVTKQVGDATMFSKRVPGQDMYVGSVVFK